MSDEQEQLADSNQGGVLVMSDVNVIDANCSDQFRRPVGAAG